MATSKLIPVIMAGGTGSRLWPLSRELYPKQFIPVKGDYTMLQSTINRLDGLDCNNTHVKTDQFAKMQVCP